jgi:hypothetical protein
LEPFIGVERELKRKGGFELNPLSGLLSRILDA